VWVGRDPRRFGGVGLPWPAGDVPRGAAGFPAGVTRRGDDS
jgi:hypothetical protein